MAMRRVLSSTAAETMKRVVSVSDYDLEVISNVVSGPNFVGPAKSSIASEAEESSSALSGRRMQAMNTDEELHQLREAVRLAVRDTLRDELRNISSRVREDVRLELNLAAMRGLHEEVPPASARDPPPPPARRDWKARFKNWQEMHGGAGASGAPPATSYGKASGPEPPVSRPRGRFSSPVPVSAFEKQGRSPLAAAAAAPPSYAYRVVTSAWVEVLTLLAICANATVLGMEIDYEARTQSDDLPLAFRGIDAFFAVFFAAEIALRMVAYKRSFLCGQAWAWNVFDLALVLFQIVEEVAAACGNGKQGWGALRLVRLLRATRAVRVVRLTRWSDALLLLVNSVLDSLGTFFWSSVLLLLSIFVISVYLTQAVTDHAAQLADSASSQQLTTWYGSLPRTMLSLFQCMTGGVGWNEVVQPLYESGFIVHCLFVTLYIGFSILAFLNIVTAAFIEKVTKKKDEVKEMRTFDQALKLFKSVDVMDSGYISYDQVVEHLESDAVQEYLKTISVEPSQVKALFDMLHADGSGKIAFEDFLMDSIRLQDPPRVADLMFAMHDVSKGMASCRCTLT